MQASPLFSFAKLAGVKPGILAAGNFWGVLPYEGRYDADFGDVLFTGKKRDFTYISPVSSGFLLHGEARDIKALRTAGGLIYAVAFNNRQIEFFKLTN